MLDGLFILLGMSLVMALASFFAGALPLSMSLSQSQLRLVSTIGMGILVGTSLIVIIPEGIETVYATKSVGQIHGKRNILIQDRYINTRWANNESPSEDNIKWLGTHFRRRSGADDNADSPRASSEPVISIDEAEPRPEIESSGVGPPEVSSHNHDSSSPTFYIGLSLILGFVLMFLIDKLPRHASETLQAPPPTRHISLNNLAQGLHESPTLENSEESESFLQSLTPSPKQTRSLATTAGLVIHATADGIAMGASASTANISLGFVIFLAIMVHKAPAAFGLTSVLLKQGLSKRAARGHLIVFSLAAPFGSLATWFVVHLLGGGGPVDSDSSQWWTGMLLLFSAGTFLYVAMHAAQEDGSSHDHSITNGYVDGTPSHRKQARPQMRDTFAAVAGMLLPLLTQFGQHY